MTREEWLAEYEKEEDDKEEEEEGDGEQQHEQVQEHCRKRTTHDTEVAEVKRAMTATSDDESTAETDMEATTALFYQQDACAQSSLASGASAGPPLMAWIFCDSTHFACKDIQGNVVYSLIHNLSAHLPLKTLRHIKWIAAKAWKDVTEEDMVQVEKIGFLHVRARMESFDVIRYLSHVVQVGFARSLLACTWPVRLEHLKRGTVRVYHQGNGRWYRVEEKERCKASSASASGVEEPFGQQELPNELMEPALVNVLLATLDQKQSQWTAMHCSASPIGLNLKFHFKSDKFHRSWRDFAGSTNHGPRGFP